MWNQLLKAAKIREQFPDKNFEAESMALYDKGLELIEQARNLDFKDPALLQQANKNFSSAIIKDDKNPWPLVGTAYLLSLFKLNQQAVPFLRKALNLQSDLKVAQALVEQLTRAEEPKKKKFEPVRILNNFEKQRENPEVNLDQFYDRLERFILHYVQFTMKQKTSFKPTHKSEELDLLFDKWQTLVNCQKKIQHNIDFLDEEFDINDLQNKLRPLQAISKRFKQCINVSAKMSSIFNTTQNAIRLSLSYLSMLIKNPMGQIPPHISQELEDIFDVCDSLADDLDTLSGKQIDISFLETEYEKMIQIVQDLQEKLDDIDIDQPGAPPSKEIIEKTTSLLQEMWF